MRKKEIIKKLRTEFKVKSNRFGNYNFEVISGNKSYFVRVLNITINHQITINSKIIWDLKKGVTSGIRFKTISSNLINLEEFNKLDNKVIFLTSKPFKILKALNESDLLDVSNDNVVNETFITSDITEFIGYLLK